MKPVLDFLAQDLYLPQYMTLTRVHYAGNKVDFDFHPVEPVVTRIHLPYLTPRGLHITLSQSGYCLAEKEAESRGAIQSGDLRDLLHGARIKIVELNQRFRREVRLVDSLQGRLVLERFRTGQMPVMQFHFDNRAITGNMVAVVSPRPTIQTNQDLLRGK